MIAGLLGIKSLAFGAGGLIVAAGATFLIWDYGHQKEMRALAEADLERAAQVNAGFADQVEKLEESYDAAIAVRDELQTEIEGLRTASQARTNYLNSKRGKFNEKLASNPDAVARLAGIALLGRMRAIEGTFAADDLGAP